MSSDLLQTDGHEARAGLVASAAPGPEELRATGRRWDGVFVASG